MSMHTDDSEQVGGTRVIGAISATTFTEASSSSTQKFDSDNPLFSETPGLSISGRTKEQLEMRKYYTK
jgi:hypothetical protein